MATVDIATGMENTIKDITNRFLGVSLAWARAGLCGGSVLEIAVGDPRDPLSLRSSPLLSLTQRPHDYSA